MAEHRPIVLINGRQHTLPIGDTLVGASQWKEPVSVFNNGDPQIVFASNGDVVMQGMS
jgi:hypothetical protein